MKLKKVLGLALVLSIGVSALVGCGGSKASEDKGIKDKENVTVAEDTDKSEDSDEAFTLKISTTSEKDDNLDLAMERFKEKYPNVEYEIITSPWSETREKQIMMMSMGDIPDIAKIGGWAQEFYRDGLTMNLTDQVKTWDIYNNLTPGQIERMSYEGDICAMNYNTNTMFMFYNKDLLEKIGANVPETFEDLKALGQKITAEGIVTEEGQKVYATNIPTGNAWELSSWVFSMGAEFMNEDYSQVTIDSQDSIDAHVLMQDFVKNEWAPIPDGTGEQLWLNGQAVTYFTGEWTIPATLDAGINPGYANVPTGKGGITSGPIGGCDWAILNDAPNKEKALEFLEDMYAVEFQILADRGVTDLAIYDNPEKQAIWDTNGLLEAKKVQQKQLETSKFVFLDNPHNFPEGANIYMSAVQKILIDGQDAKAILEEAAGEINKGMAQ